MLTICVQEKEPLLCPLRQEQPWELKNDSFSLVAMLHAGFIAGSNGGVVVSLDRSCTTIIMTHIAVVYAEQYHRHIGVYEGLPIIIIIRL